MYLSFFRKNPGAPFPYVALQNIPRDNNNAPRYYLFHWICPYISRHLLSINPLQLRHRRYSRGER
ncbi:hypothetical protein C7B19_25820 [Escherichia coli]|nr:hypothetical protein C7B19_25820 [Escherichia coli]